MAGPRSEPDDDLALVRVVVAGSEIALAALYDRYADAIYATAIRSTDDRQVAEEVVQETFLALWNRAELFDPAVGSLGTWLRSVARHRSIDRLRAAGRRPKLVSAAGEDAGGVDADALDRAAASGAVVGGADGGRDPEMHLELVETRDAIRSALRAMPDVERTVILLAYQDELTQVEIAQRLGWPLGTVKTRTRRALRRLRVALGDMIDPDDEPADGDGE